MIRILLTIILACAIYSCSAYRRAESESRSTEDSTLDITAEHLTNDDIISLITNTRELDLSGIRIEFYPPDSAKPDARASPRSVAIARARKKNSSLQAEEIHSSSCGKKTVNQTAHSSADSTQRSRSEGSLAAPSGSLILLSISGTILILIMILILKSRKK